MSQTGARGNSTRCEVLSDERERTSVLQAATGSRLRELIRPWPTASWRVTWASVVGLTLATWPIRPGAQAFGVDSSYEAALALIHDRGYEFGSDVVFNFGPLGFLAGTPYGLLSGVLAWAVQIAVALALSYLVVVLLSRSTSPPVSAVVAGIVFVAVWGSEPMPFVTRIALIAILWSVNRAATAVSWPWQVAALAGCGWGIAFLVKADTGAVAAVVTGSAVGLGTFLVSGGLCARSMWGSGPVPG